MARKSGYAEDDENQKHEHTARFAKDQSLARAESQVNRSRGGEQHKALTKYMTQQGLHSVAAEDPTPNGMEIGPITKSMKMPGPIDGPSLHKYMAQHGMTAADFMAQTDWAAQKTPLEGRDEMTDDVKIGDHDEDDYVDNDEESVNDRHPMSMGHMRRKG